MKIKAPAKVNLFLDVQRRRADGYHELETVFQTISLCDFLDVKKSKPGSGIRLKVKASGPDARFCPADERNIIWKAAKLFFEEFGIQAGCSMILEKNVPIQAGLGGGSSDAAATLKGLARLYLGRNAGLARNRRKLLRIAAKCGADVPFFLEGGCALATGIGEKVKKLVQTPKFWAVVVKPEVGCPTGEAYGWLDAAQAGAARSLTEKPKIDMILNSIRRRKGPKDWGKFLYNSFEKAVFSKRPQVAQVKTALLKCGAPYVSLSGSGSAIYGLVFSKQQGQRIQRKLGKSLGKVWVVRSV